MFILSLSYYRLNCSRKSDIIGDFNQDVFCKEQIKDELIQEMYCQRKVDGEIYSSHRLCKRSDNRKWLTNSQARLGATRNPILG